MRARGAGAATLGRSGSLHRHPSGHRPLQDAWTKPFQAAQPLPVVEHQRRNALQVLLGGLRLGHSCVQSASC